MNAPHFTVVALEQGTDAWREWRHRGIGASEASTVMGENPFRTVSDLFKKKCGSVCDFEQDTAMARGLELEPEARRLYIATTGKQVYPACLQSTRYDWLRASLDGLAVDYDGVVEIKCGKSAYRTTLQTGAVPFYNYGQTQHILALTGFNSLDFWCYWPDCSPLLIAVPRNDAYIERLLARELKLWNQVEQWTARLMQQQKSEAEVQQEAPESRNQPVTDEQKVRLKWFGCTWGEGITKGQASDAMEECIRLFPEKNQEYYDRPASEDQVKIIQELMKGFGGNYCGTEDGEPLTYGLAENAIRNLEIDATMGEACLQAELAMSEEDEWLGFNWHYGDLPLAREVTRDEFANAWALAFSRRKNKSEGPTDAEVLAAMRELVIDFRIE